MNIEISKTGACARNIVRRARTRDGIAASAIIRRPFDPVAYQAALEILG
jgi:hypothetical protein